MGIPTLNFRPRRVVPELWLAEDRQVESTLGGRAVGELERVLSEQGVPVRRFLMRGRNVGGLSVQRWVATAGSARLLLVTDGARLLGDERTLAALAAAEAGIWRIGRPQRELEAWVARGLRLVDREGLRGFLSGQRGIHQRELWPGAMQAWAAACAMSPLPVLPEDALALRVALELPVPVEALDVLMARSARRDLLQFPPEEQRELWAWAADIAPELRRKALAWWERRLRGELAPGAEAHREGLLATLKLWESPEEGLDKLAELREHPLFPELRGQLAALLQSDHANLEEKGRAKLEELGLCAPAPAPAPEPPPTSGWRPFVGPLVTGALALACVGMGTWKIFQEDARPVAFSGGEVELQPGQKELELGSSRQEGQVQGWPWRAEPTDGLVWVQVWVAGRWQGAELLRAGDRLTLGADGGKICIKSEEVLCDTGFSHGCGSCPMEGGEAAEPGKVALLAGDPNDPELQHFGRRLIDHGLVDAWVAGVVADALPELPAYGIVLGVGSDPERLLPARKGGELQAANPRRRCTLALAREASKEDGNAIDWRRSIEILENGEGKELTDVFLMEGPDCSGWVIKQATCASAMSQVDQREGTSVVVPEVAAPVAVLPAPGPTINPVPGGSSADGGTAQPLRHPLRPFRWRNLLSLLQPCPQRSRRSSRRRSRSTPPI